MTNLEDALLAVDAGADAVGFVFYEKSPRCVKVETAREIVGKLPESVEKIGVFAGLSMESAVDTSLYAGFDAVQVYPMTRTPQADITFGVSDTIGLKIYLALPIAAFLGEGNRNVVTFSQEGSPGTFDTLFLDSGNSHHPGGTGRTFDWHQGSCAVKELSLHRKVVIAVGIDAGKREPSPRGVDILSGWMWFRASKLLPGRKIRRRCGRLCTRCGQQIGRRARDGYGSSEF